MSREGGSQAGWTAVPNIFLDKIHALGLTSSEALVAILLMRYWFKADSPPFPGKDRLAKALNVAPRTVQRVTSRLEQEGLLTKTQRLLASTREGGAAIPHTNTYSLDGLKRKLEPHARDHNRDRERQAKEREATLARRRPSQEVG